MKQTIATATPNQTPTKVTKLSPDLQEQSRPALNLNPDGFSQ